MRFGALWYLGVLIFGWCGGIGSLGAHAAALPVSVTYECQGTLKAYGRRLLLDGEKGFSVSGFPGSENTELAVLNQAGTPEFLIHPALAECGCFPDDHVFVTHFGAKGPSHYDRPFGAFRFELADKSGYLDCKITLNGGPPDASLFSNP